MRTVGRHAHDGIKAKDLIGIPWMLAFALRADGWYLRQDIIWSKPNPMPESVGDRCTKAHEYLFLLSKSSRYYFDAEAIAEPIADSSVARLAQSNLENQTGSERMPGKTNGTMKAVGPRFDGTKYGDDEREESRTKSGKVWDGQRKGNRKTFRGGGVYTQGRSFDNDAQPCNDSIGNEPNARGLRNKRSVWTVATQPFKEAHFATFPPALIEPCILAGCPQAGTVLDPFGGAGTTGLVADRRQRSAILIELNPEYAEIARKRISGDSPLFAEVA
jgi:DNA modification methylase